MNHRPTSHARRGTILIVVAGLSALLATMALAFLLRMRVDGEESVELLRMVQVRAVLYAACGYVLEAGRIGWDDPNTTIHEEAYGWIDVRDGFAGPRLKAFTLAQQASILASSDPDAAQPGHEPSYTKQTWGKTAPLFPIGTIARFPLGVWKRPPCAISQEQAPNAIKTWVTNPGLPITDPLFGLPLLTKPDPQPAVSTFADWVNGDRIGGGAAGAPILRQESQGLAWFRLYRDSPATFVITAGAGATQGFSGWPEVTSGPWGDQSGLFGGSEQLFNTLLTTEVRQWFRVEWSAALSGIRVVQDSGSWGLDKTRGDNYSFQNQFHSQANACGTLNWVQRLRQPPARW